MSETTIIQSTIPHEYFELTNGEEKTITSIANNNGVYDTVQKEKNMIESTKGNLVQRIRNYYNKTLGDTGESKYAY